MHHERIRRFLADRFLFDEHAAIDREQSLIGSGVLDSTGAMELVLFLETDFRIQIEPHELVPNNLDSITRINEFVSAKLVPVSAAPETPARTHAQTQEQAGVSTR